MDQLLGERPDVNGPGGSGATWGTALTDLQAALDGVIPGTTIKVAQGTYIPSLRTDAGDTRTATFLINLDIIIEGGYVGWDAPDPNLRDPDAFPTILSGALEAGLLEGPFANCDNPPPGALDCTVPTADPGCTNLACCVAVCEDLPLCCLAGWDLQSCVNLALTVHADVCLQGMFTSAYHVVTVRDVISPSIVLDGLIITDGLANGFGGNRDIGGGVLIQDASPRLIRCTFLRNSGNSGGGVAVVSAALPGDQVMPFFLNCFFLGNTVTADGGGLFAGSASPVLMNSVFSGNTALDGKGGAVFSGGVGGESTLVNCTVGGNLALLGGGVAAEDPIFGDPSTATLTNCVVAENGAGGDFFGSIDKSFTCSPGIGGLDNVDADPQFLLIPNPGDGVWGTPNDDYGDLRLALDSLCVDAGNNVAVLPDFEDLDGDSDLFEPTPVDVFLVPRFSFSVAAGALDPCDPLVAVDMGAYENGDCNGDLQRDETEVDTNGDNIPDNCQDCDGDGIPDPVEVADGSSVDCNSNGVPDECDFVNGCSLDGNGNCVPDECECVEGLIDLVFIIDTSGSQASELDDICTMAKDIVIALESSGANVDAFFLGIIELEECIDFPGTVSTVVADAGGDAVVPGDNGACGLILDDDESWGPATAIVAERHDWTPGARKIVIPIFDEGACRGSGPGNPCSTAPGSPDRDAIDNAITLLINNGVIPLPVTGQGSGPCERAEAELLASTLVIDEAFHRDDFPSYVEVKDALLAKIQEIAGDCLQVECPWDLDNDCLAGIMDFLALLGAWGTDPGGPPDFDGDGDVGIVDFLELLGHWGLCPGVDAVPPASLASAVQGAGLIWPSDWDAFAATMTDPNASAAEKDRWSCWMHHYLDVHSRRFFIEWPNPCPAPDPFGGH